MSDWKEKLANIQKLKADAEAAANPPQPQFDEDLVPEVEPSTYVPTETDLAIDRAIDSIDCVDAYIRWCGKSVPQVGTKRKNIMIRCPIPDHDDTKTSADINLDKGQTGGVWHCHRCEKGGDKYDIAAYRFNIATPDYKTNGKYRELRKLMAEDLDVKFTESKLSHKTYAESPHELPNPAATEPIQAPLNTSDESDLSDTSPDAPQDEQDAATIIDFPQPGDFDEAVMDYPTLPWQEVVHPSGFLYDWMHATKDDDLPEEYYFWLGMVALGFAIGRDVVLEDNPVVRGNLYVCLFGPTGQGKSRSIGVLNNLLMRALPYDNNDPDSTGAYHVPSPGSAEALVDAFSRPIPDPTDPKLPPIGYGHVRGLVRFDELSTLIGRASRMGNPMKPMLMEFYDGYAPVEHKTRGMGHVRAEGYFCSTLTTTQPRAIRDLLVQTDVDSGFVNRWIFAAGVEKYRVSHGRKGFDLTNSVNLLQKVRTWAPKIKSVDLTSGGYARWDNFFHKELLPAQREEESGLLARSDLTLKKIMLLLACDRHSAHITEEIVEDTITVWTYLQKSYQLLSGEIGMGPFEDIRNAIKRAVKGHSSRHPRPPTMRDINRLIANRKFQGDIVVRVLRAMMELGELEEIKTIADHRGPSALRYKYID